ncbi:hypothetical protein Aperf_G00000063669 [Anoplocephala perfoliata]
MLQQSPMVTAHPDFKSSSQGRRTRHLFSQANHGKKHPPPGTILLLEPFSSSSVLPSNTEASGPHLGLHKENNQVFKNHVASWFLPISSFFFVRRPWRNPPHDLKLYKGAVHVVVTWDFINFLFTDKRVQDYIEFLPEVGVPDEALFSTINHNAILDAPGNFPYGDDDYRNGGSYVNRWKHFYPHECSGVWRHAVCIFDLYGMKPLFKPDSPYLFVNKFVMHLNAPVLDVTERWFYDWQDWYYRHANQSITDLDFFRNLPQVRYQLKRLGPTPRCGPEASVFEGNTEGEEDGSRRRMLLFTIGLALEPSMEEDLLASFFLLFFFFFFFVFFSNSLSSVKKKEADWQSVELNGKIALEDKLLIVFLGLNRPRAFPAKSDADYRNGGSYVNRWKHFYPHECSGVWRHAVCIFDLYGMKPLFKPDSPYLFVNKFVMHLNAPVLDVTERWFYDWQDWYYRHANQSITDLDFFRNLPQVRYQLKRLGPT